MILCLLYFLQELLLEFFYNYTIPYLERLPFQQLIPFLHPQRHSWTKVFLSKPIYHSVQQLQQFLYACYLAHIYQLNQHHHFQQLFSNLFQPDHIPSYLQIDLLSLCFLRKKFLIPAHKVNQEKILRLDDKR